MALLKINRNPSGRELRQFAGIWFPLLFAFIAWTMFRKGWTSRDFALGVFVGGAIVGAIGLAKPPVMRRIYVGWMTAVFPIGWTVSHTVLTIVFFAVITPIGFVMRLMGKDPMQRAFDRGATSYWQPREPATDVSRYFRQF